MSYRRIKFRIMKLPLLAGDNDPLPCYCRRLISAISIITFPRSVFNLNIVSWTRTRLVFCWNHFFKSEDRSSRCSCFNDTDTSSDRSFVIGNSQFTHLGYPMAFQTHFFPQNEAFGGKMLFFPLLLIFVCKYGCPEFKCENFERVN